MSHVEYSEIEIKEPRRIRSLLIGTYMESMGGLSKSEMASELTEYAINMGYVADRPALYGASLDDIFKKKSAPWWQSRSALDILMLLDWVPNTSWQWTSFAHAWLYAKGPYASLAEIIESLPPHLSGAEASHWFEPLKERFSISQHTKPVSWVVDRFGVKQTPKYLSAERAKEKFIKGKNYKTWAEAAAEKYTIAHFHILTDDLINDSDLVSEDSKKLLIEQNSKIATFGMELSSNKAI